jgi:eukaryotic-like serine/threonine-protein kinase
MNDRYQDAVIRAALTPSDEVHAPIGLADEIHVRLATTPQQARPIRARGRSLRWAPAMSPALLVLFLLLALAAVVGGAVLLQMPRPATRLGVLSYHGDQGRTGVMTGPAPVRPPIVEWDLTLPRGVKNYTMPLVADGTAYVVDVRGDVVAVDLATGQRRWTAEPFPADVSGTPLIANGLLIVPADDGIVRALDLDTGEVAWTSHLPAAAGSSIAGASDLALVGADDGFVHALDVATGQERWSMDAGGPVIKAPAIEDGIAYIVTNDGPVTAFDATTGHVRWQWRGLGPGEVATPAIRDGALYLAHGVLDGDSPYELVALDVRDSAASGPKALWRWRTPTADRLFSGALTPDAVYAISADGNVYVLDPATGAAEVLLATDGPVGSGPTVVSGVMYVASQDEHIYAVDLQTREVLWTEAVPGSPSSPVAAGGHLIVGTELGHLISFGDAPGAKSP